MPLERRKAGAPRKSRWSRDRTSEQSNETIERRPACLSYARERVPNLFLFCLFVIVFFDHEYIFETAQLEVSSWQGNVKKKIKRDGFMILGMHRSGTSMLTGLLYKAGGYTYGGHLHKGKANTKGFFERFDVVGQNDKWMNKQDIKWFRTVLDFDWEQALGDTNSGHVQFKQGDHFFNFINDQTNVPWLQKDPRMCITLRVWLKLMKKEPAILFTYRHPLEVALSLEKRKLGGLNVTSGLNLWIAYNMRAIQNSRGLCIVRTNNRAVLADPLKELQRVSDELTTKCGVVAPSHRVKQEEVDQFIDPTLQHHDTSSKDQSDILESFNGGSCVAYSFKSKNTEASPEYIQERETYLLAMRIYCDLESGKAYQDDYQWPSLDNHEN